MRLTEAISTVQDKLFQRRAIRMRVSRTVHALRKAENFKPGRLFKDQEDLKDELERFLTEHCHSLQVSFIEPIQWGFWGPVVNGKSEKTELVMIIEGYPGERDSFGWLVGVWSIKIFIELEDKKKALLLSEDLIWG